MSISNQPSVTAYLLARLPSYLCVWYPFCRVPCTVYRVRSAVYLHTVCGNHIPPSHPIFIAPPPLPTPPSPGYSIWCRKQRANQSLMRGADTADDEAAIDGPGELYDVRGSSKAVRAGRLATVALCRRHRHHHGHRHRHRLSPPLLPPSSHRAGLVKSADLLTPSEPDAGSSAPDGNI